MNKLLQRELEVAFSKHVQPRWFRWVKWLVFVSILYFFWETKYVGWIVALLLVGGFGLHFFYRYQTKGWTKSYGLWNYEKHKPKSDS